MSAFLVEDKTISKILTYLDHEIRRSNWLRAKFENELGINFDADWQTKLGQKMWDLNQLALGYRYGDEKEELTYTFSSVSCTPVEAFKALQCWMYQCHEGDIPEKSKLYTFFDGIVRKHVAEAIVMKTPGFTHEKPRAEGNGRLQNRPSPPALRGVSASKP
jgi:hypothetical protein